MCPCRRLTSRPQKYTKPAPAEQRPSILTEAGLLHCPIAFPSALIHILKLESRRVSARICILPLRWEGRFDIAFHGETVPPRVARNLRRPRTYIAPAESTWLQWRFLRTRKNWQLRFKLKLLCLCG